MYAISRPIWPRPIKLVVRTRCTCRRHRVALMVQSVTGRAIEVEDPGEEAGPKSGVHDSHAHVVKLAYLLIRSLSLRLFTLTYAIPLHLLHDQATDPPFQRRLSRYVIPSTISGDQANDAHHKSLPSSSNPRNLTPLMFANGRLCLRASVPLGPNVLKTGRGRVLFSFRATFFRPRLRVQ